MLSFISAEQIAEEEPEEPDAVVEQLLIKEAITLMSAKIKAGKTTFVGKMLHAIFNGEDIINLMTKPAKVIYCTEEGRKTFRAFLTRSGLEDTNGCLEVLFLGSVDRTLTWAEIVLQVGIHAKESNAEVVIFDTLTRWARIPADKENDAGTAALAMTPLESLRDAGLAVLAVFHDRKSGGEVADSMRGSSAFGGSADVLLNLSNPGTNKHDNRRQLKSVGRFDDPGDWTIDLINGEYVVTSEEGSLKIERMNAKEMILAYLEAAQPLTADALIAQMNQPRMTVRRACEELLKERRIRSTGKGVKGDPKCYWSLVP